MHNLEMLETNQGIILALLQIQSIPVSMGLPNPMMLFNRPIRGPLPPMNRGPININNDDTFYEALEAHQK